MNVSESGPIRNADSSSAVAVKSVSPETATSLAGLAVGAEARRRTAAALPTSYMATPRPSAAKRMVPCRLKSVLIPREPHVPREQSGSAWSETESASAAIAVTADRKHIGVLLSQDGESEVAIAAPGVFQFRPWSRQRH